jgi:hypothetical protein
VGLFDWLFGRGNREGQDQDLNVELAHWRIAEIKGDGGSVVVARVRLRRPDLADLDQYTTAVSISWPIVDDTLLPEVTPAMDEFEVSMEDFESFSYLIQVRTGLGERNWLYYSSDGDRLAAAIRSRLATHGWPLTIVTREDPSWAEWRLLAERISGQMVGH